MANRIGWLCQELSVMAADPVQQGRFVELEQCPYCFNRLDDGKHLPLYHPFRDGAPPPEDPAELAALLRPDD